MKSFLVRSMPSRAALCAAGAVAFGVLSIPPGVLAQPAPAAAEQCPRGQFFWKSKKSCIDKAEAAKLGIYHGRVPVVDPTKDKAEPAAPEEPSAPADAAAQPAEPAPAPQAEESPPASGAPADPAPSAPSPYGALVIEEFAKAK
jgi:hypothetical protein